MASFLVPYGTGEGQTASVASRIVDVLDERGHAADRGGTVGHGVTTIRPRWLTTIRPRWWTIPAAATDGAPPPSGPGTLRRTRPFNRPPVVVGTVPVNASSIAGAIAAGLATFLLVGMTVTELLARRIEFAVLVGFPAGALAGAVAVALVASGFVDDAPAGRRRLASAAGAFAITFLVAFVAGVALPIGFSLAIAAGVVLGVGVAVGAYLTGGGRAVEAP